MPAKIVGKEIELHPTLRRDLVGDLLAALVTRSACLGFESLDAEPLLGEHLLELFGHLAVGTAQVTAVELLFALEP